MLSFLAEKSLFLEYWKIFLPFIVFAVSLIWTNYKNENRVKKGSKKVDLNREKEAKETEKDICGDDSLEDSQTADSYNDELMPFLEEREPIRYAGATHFLKPGGIGEFYKIMNDRRSVRAFSTKSIDYKIIEKCILTAGTSPSGAHTEPWTFCLIESSEIKQQIREIIEVEEFTNYSQRMSRQWTTDLRPLRTNHIKPYLTDAPYLILVFKQTFSIRPNGQKQQHYYNEISTSIAIGILLCALQCAGLNSLTTTPLNCGPTIRTLLNRPTNEKLVVLIPVGYAAADCTVPNLQRKSIDEILVKY